MTDFTHLFFFFFLDWDCSAHCGGIVVPCTSGITDDSSVVSLASLCSLILNVPEELQISQESGRKRILGEVEIIDKSRVCISDMAAVHYMMVCSYRAPSTERQNKQ